MFVTIFIHLGHLKAKSELNFKAAKKLIENELYAPSVHCSYYGAFQFSTSSLANYMDYSYSDLNYEIRCSKKGSHDYIIQEVTSSIRHESDIYISRNFSNLFKDLKKFRKHSDYDDVSVDSTKSNKAFEISESLVTIIKKYL